MCASQKQRKWKILALTTTRADYGILRPLLQALSQDGSMDLRLAVTGTHLSGAFGRTIREIEADAFVIDARIPILTEENDSSQAMSSIMSHTLRAFGAYFQTHRPDFLLVLGDRYETLAVCIAAVSACIPIIHLHGGETTEGIMDECFRHCITKMSYLHFTATETYRRRVIQMGESPDRVFNVGALGVENALHTPFMDPDQLAEDIRFPVRQKPYGVVTFHPVTLEPGMETTQMEELLAALAQREDLNFLITKSNSDIGGQRYNSMIDRFASNHPHCVAVASLGMVRYMSALRYAACVIGNSSSGIIEAPSFGLPTINIGSRQRGRIQAESVINCSPKRDDILSALDRALTEEFQTKAATVKNPYGDGSTSKKIVQSMKRIFAAGEVDLEKPFYDIAFQL